jgi:hypothetical protein
MFHAVKFRSVDAQMYARVIPAEAVGPKRGVGFGTRTPALHS